MEFFELDSEFNSWNSVLVKKREYEVTTNNLLVIGDAHKLKGSGTFQENFVYDRITLNCKAGQERPTTSKGLREAFTMKKNCAVKVKTLL